MTENKHSSPKAFVWGAATASYQIEDVLGDYGNCDSIWDRYTIPRFQQKRAFSSTLPSIAGPMGIPMWVFYVNRGQAVTSFGVENKDHPIMEFQPANKAYQVTPFIGFRTFIKIIGSAKPVIYEPFSAALQNAEQKMVISLNELELHEDGKKQGLQIEIVYYTLPEERVAGLVRQLKITNSKKQPIQIEILDGLPVIIPYGVSNKDLKEHNRTIEAFMDVNDRESKVPFFRLRSTPDDTADVRSIRGGNYSLAIAVQNGDSQRLPVFVDPETVFGQNTSFSFPTKFHTQSLTEIEQLPQYAQGKTPCSFFGYPAQLAPGESVSLYSVYGYAGRAETLKKVSTDMGTEEYFIDKRNTAKALVNRLTSSIETKTNSQVFDAYCRQTFLDNVLRGGLPIHLGHAEKPVTYHIYSRKHGDPERDYNAFFLAAEHYSQGNGNYRDVNQNRRCDIWFNPRIEDTNVCSFITLIQADGYNPLIVKGNWFLIPSEKRSILLELAVQPEQLLPILEKPFTPGGLLKWIDKHAIELHIQPIDFLHQAIHYAQQDFGAEFGEGYWTDHWTYNLDQIVSFLAIYPDRADLLLFNQANIPFFESPYFVRPRSKKYILEGDQPRQYEAVTHDNEKAAMIANRKEYPRLMRSQNGHGDIYQTSLYAKLVLLATIKFATMDSFGMGIEMEADKPGWCDALNGLPGLFGSSLSETFELSRLIKFLLDYLPENKIGVLSLPVELVELIHVIIDNLHVYAESKLDERDFLYWDSVSTARETYREKTRLGFWGDNTSIAFQELAGYLSLFMNKVQVGIDCALQLNRGIPPTYFFYEVEKFEFLRDLDGEVLRDKKQRPYIRALQFRQNVLPLFLEAPVHMFKTLPDVQSARRLHQCVKDSELFDHDLNMYKTNVSLEDQPMQIGRIRAFTPGWLENESIFLHMEYKYLLELLKAGLYEDFFEDFRNALVAFQNPDRYGRSPLENSSFIVSSAHPDKSLHGTGFVARLTGATAEFINMWHIMMVGQDPFVIQNGELCLRLQPVLPSWLFDGLGKLSFTFLGHCQVTYFNPHRENTYSEKMQIRKMRLYFETEQIDISGDLIGAPYAGFIRAGQVRKIDIFF